MKRVLTQAAAVAATVFLTVTKACAQTDLPKYEFGLNVGFTVYQGDLTPNRFGSIETQKFSVGLHASRILTSSFSARANLHIGKLKGDEAVYDNPAFRKMRAFQFTSPVTEFSLQAVWNVMGRNYADKGFSPYVFAGGGLAFLTIRRDWSRFNAAYFSEQQGGHITNGIAADSLYKLPRVIPVIPLGAGIKYFFSPNFGVNAEAVYRLSCTGERL